MRISDEDRSLAIELVDALGLDSKYEGPLRVILSSHRQLPSDEKASGIQLPADPRGSFGCKAIHPASSGEIPLRCTLRDGHMGDHHTVDGRYVWEQS